MQNTDLTGDRDNLARALRFWVNEASAAVYDIAYLETFDETGKVFEARRKAGAKPKDPQFNPLYKVARRRLYATTDTLILFCQRATENSGGYSIKTLKNKLCDPKSTLQQDEKDELKKHFKAFESRNKDRAEIAYALRNEIVAHADKDIILGKPLFGGKPLDIILYARDIVACVQFLTEKSGLKPKGTIESPVISDPSLVITSHKGANFDALEFWNAIFAALAK